MYNVGIRFHEQNVIIALQIHHQGQCPTITKVIVCFIIGVRCDDNPLRNYITELIGDHVRSVFSFTTKPDKVTLNDRLGAWQIIKARMKNVCYIAFIMLVNLIVRVSNTDLLFVEHCLSAHEERTRCRISPPHNRRSTVDLNAQSASSSEPIQNVKIASQDGVFGVLLMLVLHWLFADERSMARGHGARNPLCATCSTVRHGRIA